MADSTPLIGNSDDFRIIWPPRIPGFEWGGVLDKGTYGEVRRIFQQSMAGRLLCCKILAEEHLSQTLKSPIGKTVAAREHLRQRKRRIREEALLLASLVSASEDRRRFPSVIDRGTTTLTVKFSEGGEGEEKYWPYFIMELIEGDSIQKVLTASDGPWAPQATDDARPRRFDQLSPEWRTRLLNVLVEIACGLYEAHRQGVVHLDMNPDNVLLPRRSLMTPEPEVTLIDWGLAQRLSPDPDDAAGKLPRGVGRADYIAPELMPTETEEAITPPNEIDSTCDRYVTRLSQDGADSVGAVARDVAHAHYMVQGHVLPGPAAAMQTEKNLVRAEIYALGGIGYFLLTGEAPRQSTADDREQWIREMREQALSVDHHAALYERVRKSGAPAFWVELVTTCLRYQPGDRYPDMGTVVAQIDKHVSSQSRGKRTRERIVLAAIMSMVGAISWVLPSQHQAAMEKHRRQIIAIVEQALADGRDYQDVLDRLPDGPERLRYQVLRLPILLKNNERLLVARELDALAPRQSEMDDSTVKTLLLFKSDPGLNPMDPKDELRKRLNQALERPGQLSYQDNAYAEGLASWLAGHVEEALALFAQAGPSHHRARCLQLQIRLERGEYGIARSLAVQMRGDFPKDPLPLLAQAMLDLISDNAAAGKDKIDSLCQCLDESHQAVLRRYWDYVLGIHPALLRFVNSNKEFEGLILVFQINSYRGRLRRVIADSMLEAAVLELPLATRLLATADSLFDAFQSNVRREGSQVSRLIKASRQNPEALLVRMAAGIELEAALAADRLGDVQALERHLQNVKAYCEEACQTPTLYPSIHYQCKLVQAIGIVLLVHIAPDIPHAALDQLRTLLSQILEEANRWPADHERGLQSLIDAIAAQPTQEQSAAWHLEIESNRLLYREKQEYLISMAKHYLRKWESIQSERKELAPPVLGASAVGFGALPPGQGSFLAASALIAGRTKELIGHLRQVLDRADTR